MSERIERGSSPRGEVGRGRESSKRPLARIASLLFVMALLSGFLLAQDPFVVAPRAYKRDFENDWVRVVSVHYSPFEKIAAHDHPGGQAVFIYLNDGGPVRFQHVEGFSGSYPATRPATKAGAFRLARVQPENHQVENLSELPSDFLQVELKTEAIDVESFNGRYPPEQRSSKQPGDYRKVEFENGQLRITRLVCKSDGRCGPLEMPHAALLIALSPVNLRLSGKGADWSEQKLTVGQTKWLEPGSRFESGSASQSPGELLTLEFKSKPVQQKAADKD